MISDLELEDIKLVADELNFDGFKNKTILISGGTGFIGSFLISVFKYRNEKYNDNIHVISLSRKGGIDFENIKNVKCDITKDINIDDNIDYIFHLASNTHPKQYKEDPVGTILTNILGCNNLLKLAVQKKVKRFILASSVEIYGQGPEYPMNEMYSGYIDCNTARSGYNESKRVCEALCQSYNKQFGIDFVTARFSRLIGPDRKQDTKAISQFMDKALANENIVLKSLGNQLFSYCYISDAVKAVLLIATKGVSTEAYNIAGEFDDMTLCDYAKFIANLANINVTFEIEDDDAVSKATYALLDCSKIKKLGYKPSFSIKEGLRRTYIIRKSWMNN
ncbi:MAG: NAD-dependent epimerase/dehydratase family protein [Anaeroplasma sp.]|nr:NAD-dependent epimerase/dehydratase family protein [Anaeroplasma sp.]